MEIPFKFTSQILAISVGRKFDYNHLSFRFKHECHAFFKAILNLLIDTKHCKLRSTRRSRLFVGTTQVQKIQPFLHSITCLPMFILVNLTSSVPLCMNERLLSTFHHSVFNALSMPNVAHAHHFWRGMIFYHAYQRIPSPEWKSL